MEGPRPVSTLSPPIVPDRPKPAPDRHAARAAAAIYPRQDNAVSYGQGHAAAAGPNAAQGAPGAVAVSRRRGPPPEASEAPAREARYQCSSKAPISQAGPHGRDSPRWSVA